MIYRFFMKLIVILFMGILVLGEADAKKGGIPNNGNGKGKPSKPSTPNGGNNGKSNNPNTGNNNNKLPTTNIPSVTPINGNHPNFTKFIESLNQQGVIKIDFLTIPF